MAAVAAPGQFRTAHKVSVVVDIIDQIKALVRASHYGPGTRLPSERDLAVQLGVSRPSVREALRTLALMGVLDTRQGSGTQIAGTGSNLLKAPFEFLILLEQPSLAELYEARELIEVFLAGRAAERHRPQELDALAAALGALRDAVAAPDHWVGANLRFHRAIWAAAHHRVLERIMNSLQDGILLCSESSRAGLRNNLRKALALHEAIFEAIRLRKADDARRAMAADIRYAVAALQRRSADQGTTRKTP